MATDEKKHRVLVVDDDALVLRAVARTLSSATTDVVTATSGAQALERLAEGGVDVIVSDISMPEMDGVALIRAVRLKDPDVPVIFLTGSPTLDTAMSAMELTAFRYMQKPAKNEELRQAVDEALRAHPRRRR